MPRPRTKEEIRCRYFRWLMGRRKNVYFADGRGNSPNLGRQSLGTRHRATALQALADLDLTMAVRHGLADPKLLQSVNEPMLDWVPGREFYEAYVRRPHVAGGPRKSTAKRYRPVLDKFIQYATKNGFHFWNEVDRQLLDGYAAWLDGESYAYATEYLELTTIKQILKYFVDAGHLPSSTTFAYPLKKPQGTDTYCWKPDEVQAMLEHCNRENLIWHKQVIVALASTGLRISELASLRWTDLETKSGFITLVDDSFRKSRSGRERRTTKSGKSRSFPIHPELEEVLAELPRHSDGLVLHGLLGGKLKADRVRQILIREILSPLADRFPSADDEVGFKDGRLHSFRHYFCSMAANSNVPERIVMTWLGHANSRMVRHYYYLHDDESVRHMQHMQKVNIY